MSDSSLLGKKNTGDESSPSAAPATTPPLNRKKKIPESSDSLDGFAPDLIAGGIVKKKKTSISDVEDGDVKSVSHSHGYHYGVYLPRQRAKHQGGGKKGGFVKGGGKKAGPGDFQEDFSSSSSEGEEEEEEDEESF